jgi:hypothetical protein
MAQDMVQNGTAGGKNPKLWITDANPFPSLANPVPAAHLNSSLEVRRNRDKRPVFLQLLSSMPLLDPIPVRGYRKPAPINSALSAGRDR